MFAAIYCQGDRVGIIGTRAGGGAAGLPVSCVAEIIGNE